MLVAVCGSSGLDDVVGISSSDRTALLRATSAHPADHVIVLAPRHAASVAREQAHVLVAADPSKRVCVLPLGHHAFSLTVIARNILSDSTWLTGRSDPGAAVQLIRQSATRSRSLVWYPHVWGLKQPTPTIPQLVLGLVGKPGFFSEVGVPAGLVRSRDGDLIGERDVLYVPADPPATLQSELGDAETISVPVTVDPSRPYATKACVELTVYVGAVHAPFAGATCTSCSATLVEDGCVFCQHGPSAGAAPARASVAA